LSPWAVAVPEVGFPCNHAGLRTRLVALSPLSPGDKQRTGRQGRDSAQLRQPVAIQTLDIGRDRISCDCAFARW
jgi:hypothetical protein